MKDFKFFCKLMVTWEYLPAGSACQPLPDSACGLVLLPPATTVTAPKTFYIFKRDP